MTLPVTVSDGDTPGTFKYGNLYGELLEYIIPVDVTFYALMVGAVIALRRQAPALDRPYRTIGYPLPVLIYNVPPLTAYDIPVEVVTALAEHTNIIGMKESSRDQEKMPSETRLTPASCIRRTSSCQTDSGHWSGL